MAETRVVTCAKGHVFSTSEERSWNGLYCPSPVLGGQCCEPLYDSVSAASD